MQDYIICNLKEKSNMERKYIFFDIDGTLLDDNPGGKILESTYRTLDKLKRKWAFCCYCDRKSTIYGDGCC